MTGEVQAAAHSHRRWLGILPETEPVGKKDQPNNTAVEIIEEFGLVKSEGQKQKVYRISVI